MRTDDEFLAAVEQGSLPASEFDHRGHLRLTWLFLERHGLEEAVDRVAGTIRSYALAKGATGKFHHTLTEAAVRIVAARKQACRVENFEDFLVDQDDLVNNLPGLIARHYSAESLATQAAREGFVSPDRAPLPGIGATE
ncbi:MAG: hypothetical protein PVJ40_00060 [Gammaproteobacteria bacterium]